MSIGRYKTFSELQSAVVEARSQAQVEARRACGKGFIRSRGTWFCTLSDKEGLVPPRAENWAADKITAKTLSGLIDDVLKKYPKVDSITISGGFDFAESMQAFNDHAYDPWVSEWSITVWTRTGVYPESEAPEINT